MVVLGFEYLGTYLLLELVAELLLVAGLLALGMTLVPTAVCDPAVLLFAEVLLALAWLVVLAGIVLSVFVFRYDSAVLLELLVPEPGRVAVPLVTDDPARFLPLSSVLVTVLLAVEDPLLLAAYTFD